MNDEDALAALLFNMANRQQVYLERLKAGYSAAWPAVQETLRRKIRSVLSSLEIENLQELSRKELQKTLIQLRSAHTEITVGAMGDFVANMPGLATYAAGLEISGLQSLAGKAAKFNAPTAQMAYQAALENPVQATGQLVGDLIKGWSQVDAMRVSNLVQKGWGQGMTLQQMIREAIGTGRNNYEDGFLAKTAKDAGTVIHTTTQHVANAARMEVWERNGDIVEKYKWISTLDRRTTQQCKSLDGQTFEPGKGPMPPIHPNCRSTTVAVMSPEFASLAKGRVRASSGPSAGYVSADLDYYDWLKTQPKAFQDIAMGPQRGKLFRDGGLTPERFRELNIGRNFEPLSLAEMKKIEPEAFKLAGLN